MTHGTAMVFLMRLLISIMELGAAKIYKESKMNQKASPPYETRGPPRVLQPEKGQKVHSLWRPIA